MTAPQRRTAAATNSRSRALDERLANRLADWGWFLITPAGEKKIHQTAPRDWPDRTSAALTKDAQRINARIANRLLEHGWSVSTPEGKPWTHTGDDGKRSYWSAY